MLNNLIGSNLSSPPKRNPPWHKGLGTQLLAVISPHIICSNHQSMELLSARIDVEGLVAFGFYICMAAESHPLSNRNHNKMISASDCLCDHEPQLFLCHGWKPRSDDENYISRFRSKDEYLKMSEEINALYRTLLRLCT